MALFLMPVLVLLEEETAAAAADSMHAIMTENLQQNGVIKEWSYADAPDGSIAKIRRVPAPWDRLVKIEDEALGPIYAASVDDDPMGAA